MESEGFEKLTAVHVTKVACLQKELEKWGKDVKLDLGALPWKRACKGPAAGETGGLESEDREEGTVGAGSL
jgi:hypothetical protein